MPSFDTHGYQYQDLTLKIQELKRDIRDLKIENVVLKKQLKLKITSRPHTVTCNQLLSFCDSDND